MKKYSGVLGMLILAVISALVVGLNYKGLNYTVSNHSAENVVSTVSFCTFGTIATLLIAYSLLFYIPQKWDVGKAYKIPANIFSLSFIVTCMYPNDPGVVTLHDIGAWGIVLSGFALMVVFALRLWQQYSVSLGAINALYIAISLAMAFIAIFHNKFLWEYILVFEPAMIAMIFSLHLCLILGKPREVTEIGLQANSRYAVRLLQFLPKHITPSSHSDSKSRI